MLPAVEDLRSLTAAEVRQAVQILRSNAETANLFGFALCTDDDVSGLYHIACTREWVREKEQKYKNIGFIYVEWKQHAGHSLFDPISKRLSALEDQPWDNDEAYEAARDERFQALVLALKDCRESGVFDPGTLLCVGSTDPCGYMASLAMQAVDLLNTKPIADEFALALRYDKYRKPV
jgi:hypothetical protein